MSRCFPFPPPGYEKKPRTESIDLLTKEKHKEKKHKKEKKDKEKREHKDKKDKDRSKDKHKEKKDRKEKHKDRKKENDKEKGSLSEDRKAEDQIEGHPFALENRPKAEDAKDSKFMEELHRRTRDEGAANHLVGGFPNSSIQRNIGGMGAAADSPNKESFADNKTFSVEIGSIQRKSGGSDQPIGNVASSQHTASMERERIKMHEKVTFGSGVAQNRYHGISRPLESTSGFVNRKSTGYAAEMEKEKIGQNEVASTPKPGLGRGKSGTNFTSSTSLASFQRRNDAFGLSVENMSSIHSKSVGRSTNSIHGGIEQVGTSPGLEKGRAKGREASQLPLFTDQRRNNFIVPPVEKDGYQKVETNNYLEETTAKNRKAKGDDGEKKTKAKDKKEEKIVEKAEDVENNKLRNIGKKVQIDSLNSKPLSPHKYNKPSIVGVDGTPKKRMGLEANGFIHENDARPDKKPRITPTAQPLSNGRKMELHLSPPSNISLKSGAMLNNMKPDKVLESKPNKINGSAKTEQIPVEAKLPVAGSLPENGDASVKAPHPDTKFLSKIYTVPKMEDWPEVDEQEWLFNRHASQQKPLALQPEAVDAPQVWAQALQFDPPDFFALPYVVPF